jgi:pilus assembly protein Flp/PilA
MQHKIRCFIQDDSGATAIEYALIATFVALAIITAATSVGTNLSNTFSNVSNGL